MDSSSVSSPSESAAFSQIIQNASILNTGEEEEEEEEDNYYHDDDEDDDEKSADFIVVQGHSAEDQEEVQQAKKGFLPDCDDLGYENVNDDKSVSFPCKGRDTFVLEKRQEEKEEEREHRLESVQASGIN